MRAKLKKLWAFLKDWRKHGDSLKWMGRQAKPFIGLVAITLGIDVVSTLVGVGSSVVGKYVVDAAVGGGSALYRFIGLMAGVTLFSIAVGAVSSMIATYVSERFSFGVRARVFDNVLRGAWRKVSAYHSGDLMTRMTSDVGAVADGITGLVPGLIMLFVRLIAAFGVLFYYDSGLALFALVLGPVGAVLSLLFSEKLAEYSRKLKESESGYRSFMQETVSNLVVVKAFEREDAARDRMDALRRERLSLVLKRNRMGTLMNVCMRLVFSMGYVVAFSWGAYRLSNGSITYGTMTLFLSLVSQVQGPIMNLARTVPQIVSVLTSAERVREIDEMPLEIKRVARDTPARVGLRMTDVSFRYDAEQVLTDVNIDIRPGDAVGIVGYSGSGKTTLIRLALALVSPDAGRIEFYGPDGAFPADVDARACVTYVPQGNSLTSGTIEENLRVGRADAGEDDMWAALETADAEGFVRKLPEGLKTPLAERAGGLSEGQAQRIAIARALLRDAPLLILDEATSALDEATESRVLEKLRGDGRGQTRLIITHRRSMLRYCNRALEIDSERVREIDPKA